MHPLKIISILSPALLLTGCLTTPSSTEQAPIEYYQPPQAHTNTATIISDRVERKSILADTVAYVFAVDGKKVIDGDQNTNTALTLEAGERDLQLWCQKGGFKYSNVLKVNIQPNRQYQVGYQFQPKGKNTCYLWVYDITAKQGIGELTEGVEFWERADPKLLRPMTGYTEPTPRASSINVPIIINNSLK